MVIVGAYLHDIYHLQTKNHKIHEIKGAEFTEKFLKKYDITKERIELIRKCVLNHRGSKKRKRESIEEKIVSCADAMDHINRFEHMFYRKSKAMEFEELIKWLKEKMKRGYKKVELKEGRKIIQKKYDSIKIILDIK